MGVTLTKDMIEGAQATQKKYGVPASVTLAQILQESGGSNKGGLSGLAYNYNNLFGITAGSSWDGETVTMSNKAGTDTKTYRVYNSIQDSIDDHAKILTNERYTQYTKNATNAYEYAEGIAKGGYAEDKNYASSLINLIKSNDLTKYDNIDVSGSNGTDTSTDNTTPSHSSGGGSNPDAPDTDLKWWGDFIVVVLVVLIIILGIVFFINAFNIKPLNGIKQKIKGAVS